MPIDTRLQDVSNGRGQGSSGTGSFVTSLLGMALRKSETDSAHAREAENMVSFKSAVDEMSSATTTEDMLKVQAKWSFLAAKPGGSQVLNAMDNTMNAVAAREAQTSVKQMQVAIAKQQGTIAADMVRRNYDPLKPEDHKPYWMEVEEENLIKETSLLGKDASGLLKLEDYDEFGNLLPGVKGRIKKDAPASQTLLSRERIEGNKLEAAKIRSSANSILADRRMTIAEKGLQLRELGFSLREAEDAIKAAELGYKIEGGPVLPSNPDGVKLTPIERPATTATTTKLQGQSLDGARAISALDDSIKTIQNNPEAFGLRGAVGQVVEKVKGQLNPNDPMDTPISNARQKASIAFADIAKSLRTDSGNMSKYELTKLEQAGSILDWSESPQIALMKQKNLLAVVIGQQLRNLKARNAPVDDTLLKKIDPSEVIGLGQEGLLTEDELRRWHRMKP